LASSCPRHRDANRELLAMPFERSAIWVPAACALVAIACVASNEAPSPDHGAIAGSAGATTSSGAASGAGGASAAGGAAGAASLGGASSGGASSGGASAGAATGGSSGASSGSSGGSSAGSGAGSASTFHVFLLLGQSNMAGYPKAEAADKTENPRIKVLGYDSCAATGRQQDQWDVALPPLHECWNSAIGPGDYFSKTLIDVIPPGDTIGLVPCAISGEKIETFLKSGGTKYDWIVQRAELARQVGGVIEGILFHQGESNCTDASWPGKVNTLVTDLRNDLSLGNVPFLAGELAPTGSCSAHNTLVNQLPSLISNAHVVSASGLTLDPTDTTYNVHFGHDSQVTFGQRYAAKMVQALGW
jgi:hypothetical protein